MSSPTRERRVLELGRPGDARQGADASSAGSASRSSVARQPDAPARPAGQVPYAAHPRRRRRRLPGVQSAIDPAAAYIESEARLGRRARPSRLAGLAARRLLPPACCLHRRQDLAWPAHRLPRDRHDRHFRDHPGASQEHGLADPRHADRVAPPMAGADPQRAAGAVASRSRRLSRAVAAIADRDLLHPARSAPMAGRGAA